MFWRLSLVALNVLSVGFFVAGIYFEGSGSLAHIFYAAAGTGVALMFGIYLLFRDRIDTNARV